MYVMHVPETPCTFLAVQELTMATAATNNGTKITPTTEIPETAKKAREQVLSTVKQGQQLSIDAAQSWVKAVSVISVPDLPKIPGVPSVPNIEVVTKFGFDLAAELLSSQRDFALQLVKILAPAKSV
jgi:hypothetical protein